MPVVPILARSHNTTTKHCTQTPELALSQKIFFSLSLSPTHNLWFFTKIFLLAADKFQILIFHTARDSLFGIEIDSRPRAATALFTAFFPGKFCGVRGWWLEKGDKYLMHINFPLFGCTQKRWSFFFVATALTTTLNNVYLHRGRVFFLVKFEVAMSLGGPIILWLIWGRDDDADTTHVKSGLLNYSQRVILVGSLQALPHFEDFKCPLWDTLKKSGHEIILIVLKSWTRLERLITSKHFQLAFRAVFAFNLAGTPDFRNSSKTFPTPAEESFLALVYTP